MVSSFVNSVEEIANISTRLLKRSVNGKVLPRGVTGRGPKQSALMAMLGVAGRGIDRMG